MLCGENTLSKPKLRLFGLRFRALSLAFAVGAGGCSDYLRVSGIGTPISSKACRWAGVGSVSMGMVAVVPLKRTSLWVSVARWSSRPPKL